MEQLRKVRLRVLPRSWSREEAPRQSSEGLQVVLLPESLRLPSPYHLRCLESWLAHVGDALLGSMNRRCVNAVALSSMLVGAPAGISICTVKNTLNGLSSPATMELVVYAGIGWLGAAVVVANARFLVLPLCWGTFQSLRRRQRMRHSLIRRAERLGLQPVAPHPEGPLRGMAAALGRIRGKLIKTASP